MTSRSFHLKQWKDATDNLKEMFSTLTIVRDTPTAIHNEQHNKVFTDSVRKLEGEVKELKVNFSALCETVEKLREENEQLEKRLNENKVHKSRKTRYKKELELEHKILAKSKMSSEDELLKENTKLRYKALRNMVQVKFFYDKTENNTLDGFVFNKTYNKIVQFNISLSTNSQQEITDRILSYMEQVSGNTLVDSNHISSTT